MASEQLARRDNTTTEREIYVEKDRVPKMATHFEHLAEQVKDSDVTGGKETPQGNVESLQGGEYRKEHAGKAIGDVGGRGKARETHELGTHFESLADIKGEDHREKESDHAANVVGNREGEKAIREREGRGGVRDVGKFEMKADGKGEGKVAVDGGNMDREELEKRTREVTGRTEKETGRGNKGQVVAEKGREREEAKGRVGGENESATTVITCTLEKGAGERGREEDEAREENEISTWEEIPEYRDQLQQNVKDKYDRAKQGTSETLSNTAQTAQEQSAQAKNTAMEKATQAKDATVEKGQQGYAATKDTIKSAMEKTAPMAEKAKGYTVQAAEKAKCAGGTTVQYVGEKAVQAKDVTVESGKGAAGYAGKLAADLKDKATAAGWAAAHYSTEKTVEGTKAAVHVVEGAAGYAGNKAAELASKSVGAVKGLASSAGETAKGYTARKKEEAKREVEAKRAALPQEADGRASEGIGETVSQYAQKLKPSEGSPQQEGKGSSVLTSIGETVGNLGEKIKKPFESITGAGTKDSGNDQSEGQGEGQQWKGSQTLTTIGEKLGDAAQRMKEPLDNITEGGSEVLEAVGETVGEIGNNMIKPAEKVQQHDEEGGMLSAIGETIVEIAQTTKVMVTGEGEREPRQSVGSESRLTDRAKHEGSQSA